MPRERKRIRQRRQRPVREGASVPAQGRVVRSDLPGSLDHVGEVDEFDAALVRGAQGALAEPAQAAAASDAEQQQAEVAVQPASGKGGDGAGGNGSVAEALGGEAAVPARRAAAQPAQGNRVAAFLRASWAELQRVQWPDRPAVSQATAVVLGFVAIMGAYLGIADWVAQKIVNFIL